MFLRFLFLFVFYWFQWFSNITFSLNRLSSSLREAFVSSFLCLVFTKWKILSLEFTSVGQISLIRFPVGFDKIENHRGKEVKQLKVDHDFLEFQLSRKIFWHKFLGRWCEVTQHCSFNTFFEVFEIVFLAFKFQN